MVYQINSYEVCAKCKKFVLRDIKGEHIIIPDDKDEGFCSCGDIE